MVFSGHSTNKTDHHDVIEMLLKVALNTINQTNQFGDLIIYLSSSNIRHLFKKEMFCDWLDIMLLQPEIYLDLYTWNNSMYLLLSMFMLSSFLSLQTWVVPVVVVG